MSRPPSRAARHTPLAIPPAHERPSLAAWALVVVAAAIFYGPNLTLPFLGDDYIFLERTRVAGFAELWSRQNTDFHWYRPWSRDFYFWAVQKVAGANPVAFHLANLLLWVASLLLFGAAVRRLSDDRTAVVTVAGAATLSLWCAPLLWISGSQDLWMCFFMSAALLALVHGRLVPALACYAGALLSKENAAVFPPLVAAVGLFAERRPVRDVLRRTLPFAILTLAWIALHPVLVPRLLGGRAGYIGTEVPMQPWGIAAKIALSLANADQLGDVLAPEPIRVVITLFATLALAGAIELGTRVNPGSGRNAMARLGVTWAAICWAPLFLPSIGYHAYYACAGALGAWLAAASWLQDRRRLLLVLVCALGVLRIFNTAARSWDWGSEWFQRRAGTLLGGVRAQLLTTHPTLAPHTRVYFGSIPNNIGLVAGSSPVLRVWYDDPTLQAGFYSYYRPRTAAEPSGPDLFFHFDTTLGLQEVRLGPEDVATAVRLEPGWERNHESVATLFVGAGDPARAAGEFEKIAHLVHRPDALMFAAVCREAVGDTSRARMLLTAAEVRTGGTPAEIEAWADRLRTSMPGRAP